jgi:acetamidase/formamidase
VIHDLPLERPNLHGHFSCDLTPVLEIDPADSVRFAVPNAGWWLDEDTRFEPLTSPEDDGHPLAGPIAVRGVRAGDTLAVRIDQVEPGAWGETLTRPPHRIDWRLADGVGVASTGQRVVLRPFLGVMGMPPAESGLHSTIPPRPHGGNIDCKELVAGTTLFLPVTVDGALFSAGDGHAAQGDGEVSGTAIECPVRAQVTLDVRRDLPVDWPCARIDGAWLAFGFGADLDTAAQIATGGVIRLMQYEHDLLAADALALASVVVDLRVTQVVNGQVGVHAVLRDDAWT